MDKAAIFILESPPQLLIALKISITIHNKNQIYKRFQKFANVLPDLKFKSFSGIDWAW